MRYDMIRDAKESKSETIEKIKDLLNKNTATIKMDEDGNPETDEDIQILLDWMASEEKDDR